MEEPKDEWSRARASPKPLVLNLVSLLLPVGVKTFDEFSLSSTSAHVEVVRHDGESSTCSTVDTQHTHGTSPSRESSTPVSASALDSTSLIITTPETWTDSLGADADAGGSAGRSAVAETPGAQSLAAATPKSAAKQRAEVRVDIVSFPGAPFSSPMRCWTFEEPTQILLFEHFRQHVSFFVSLCVPNALKRVQMRTDPTSSLTYATQNTTSLFRCPAGLDSTLLSWMRSWHYQLDT